MFTDDGQVLGYKPEKGETYLALVGRNGAFLERAACLTGVAELTPAPLSVHPDAAPPAPQPNAATTVSIGRNSVRLSAGYSMNSAQAR